MGHFSSGAPPSLAFQPATQSAQIHFWDFSAYKCITYSVLPNASIWHYICTLGFKTHFKLVMFLGIRTETSCPILERHSDADYLPLLLNSIKLLCCWSVTVPDIGYTRARYPSRVSTDIGIILQYTDIGLNPISSQFWVRYRVIQCSNVHLEPCAIMISQFYNDIIVWSLWTMISQSISQNYDIIGKLWTMISQI